MSSIKKRVTVTANGEVVNVLAGSAFEFVGRPSRITVALAQEATIGIISADIQVGPELLAEGAEVSNETGLREGAKLPDNLVVEDFAAAGDRVVVRLRETQGTETDVSVFVRIEPA